VSGDQQRGREPATGGSRVRFVSTKCPRRPFRAPKPGETAKGTTEWASARPSRPRTYAPQPQSRPQSSRQLPDKTAAPPLGLRQPRGWPAGQLSKGDAIGVSQSGWDNHAQPSLMHAIAHAGSLTRQADTQINRHMRACARTRTHTHKHTHTHTHNAHNTHTHTHTRTHARTRTCRGRGISSNSRLPPTRHLPLGLAHKGFTCSLRPDAPARPGCAHAQAVGSDRMDGGGGREFGGGGAGFSPSHTPFSRMTARSCKLMPCYGL
jgi:hypothetical protein